LDGAPPAPGPVIKTAVPELTTTFTRSNGKPGEIPGHWPGFRGGARNNICADDTPLSAHWDETGPQLLWSIPLGEGHAGAAVWAGRVYVLDYDETAQADTLRCLSFADGAEIWRRAYPVKVKRNHGMSRTVPAVDGRYVVTIGPRCHVMCVDAVTGDLLWLLDMVRTFGTEVPLWYTGQCPLLERGNAILAPGGTALLVAIDCATGNVVWETPNPDGWQMSHSSVTPMRILDRDMYVYCALGGIVAVAADGTRPGTVLWQTTEWNNRVTAPSPVQISESRIFVTAGHGAGSMFFEIEPAGETFAARSLGHLSRSIFASEQQTPIFLNGHLYAVLPKDAGDLREQFACLNPDDRTQPKWSSGKTERFGLGPFLAADGKILVLSDNGELTLLRASVTAYEVLQRRRVLDGHDAWAPMALVAGRLLLRDSKRMICLDLRADVNPDGR